MGRPKGRPPMLGKGSERVRGVTLAAGQIEAIRRLQAAELAAAGVEPPRAEVIRRALDAGLPALERGNAPGLAATPAPAPPDGPTLADVLAEVRALRGELPDLVAVVEAPPVRAVSEDAGPIGLLIGGADNLEAAAALITRAAKSLAVHADDARALVDRLPGVRAAAAEVRALVRKLEGRAVAPAPASAPRPPEHDPAQLDIEHDATTLAGVEWEYRPLDPGIPAGSNGRAKPETEPEHDPLAAALAAWMVEHKVGTTRTSDMVGVHQSTVSKWKTGKRGIDPKHRAKVEALIAAPPPAEG